MELLTGEGFGCGVDLARTHRLAGKSEHQRDRFEYRAWLRWSWPRLPRTHGRLLE